MDISRYNQEQLDAMKMVCRFIASLSPDAVADLKGKISDYMKFRNDVEVFFNRNFNTLCMDKCYQTGLSACCTHEGIITFFADVVINVLHSTEDQCRRIIQALEHDQSGKKCVYLGPDGCLWQVKPIVCEMFLCDAVTNQVFSQDEEQKKQWDRLKQREKQFKWPDKPVIFDELEDIFIANGFSSSLMYFHNSPGLLRIKQNYLQK